MLYMYVLVFFLGASVGSYLNCQAFRKSSPQFKSQKRSVCPHCKENLRWYDLIPIFSYLQIKGKCRYCEENIPKRYFLAEVKYGLLFLVIFIIVIQFIVL